MARGGSSQTSEQPKIASKITLSVEVDDGSYVSSITIPIDSTKEQRDSAVELWLGMMKQAIDLLKAPEAESSNAPTGGES